MVENLLRIIHKFPKDFCVYYRNVLGQRKKNKKRPKRVNFLPHNKQEFYLNNLKMVKKIIFTSPIIGEFWWFFTIGVCKLAEAQFIPHYIRDCLRRPVCGTQMRPLPPDSPKRLCLKVKALIFLRALKHGAGCFALIGSLLQKNWKVNYLIFNMIFWWNICSYASFLDEFISCHDKFLQFGLCNLQSVLSG